MRGALHVPTATSGVIRFAGGTDDDVFATWDAVTELRFDPQRARETATIYAFGGVRIIRFRGTHEAWLAETRFAELASGTSGTVIDRRGNVVAIGGSRAVVGSALDRLP